MRYHGLKSSTFGSSRNPMHPEMTKWLKMWMKLPKKQALAPLRKRIIKPGEFPYDLSQRKRSKCAYCTYTCYNNMIYCVLVPAIPTSQKKLYRDYVYCNMHPTINKTFILMREMTLDD
jgi:hypothetical protein